jgi:type 1 fimbria pilin
MKKMLTIALLLAFTAGTAIAADTVVLTAKNGDVTFNHKVHSESMDCKVCHGDGKPGKVDLTKDTAHALCKDCHVKKAAGPTKCGECHKKK